METLREELIVMFGKNSKQPWQKTTRISCGVLLRNRTDVIEHQCPKCNHWSIRWAEAVESKFCPHCGARIISDKNSVQSEFYIPVDN